MGWKARVLAGQDSSLVGHELAQEIGVLKVGSVDGKIDFRLRARCAALRGHAASPAALGIPLLGVGFARHKRLLDFAMECVATQGRIVFFNFQLLGLELLVASGDVARGRFAFLARFGALNGNDFAGHGCSSVLRREPDYSFSLAGFSSGSSSSSTSTAPALSTVPSCPRRRWRRAPSRSNWAWASTVNRVQGMAARRALGIDLPVSSQIP